MQQVASVSGLCSTDPSTKLSIHPTYGAWLSFRAVVVYTDTTSIQAGTGASPLLKQPSPMSYFLSDKEKAAAELAMQNAIYASGDESQLCKKLHGGEDMLKDNLYQYWIALRDCVEIGKAEFRFSESQLMYHYTKDRKFLE